MTLEYHLLTEERIKAIQKSHPLFSQYSCRVCATKPMIPLDIVITKDNTIVDVICRVCFDRLVKQSKDA